MKRLLQFTGLIAWIIGIASLVVYLKNNNQIFNDFLRFVGLLSLVAIISYSIFRIIWGDKWMIKGGKAFFIGNDLIKSFNQFLEEQPNPTNQTTANLAGHLVYRVTRLGAFAFLIGFLPAILLWQQNNLFKYQNKRIDEQTTLFHSQDSLIRIQTNLFKEQNNSILAQTGLLKSQDTLTRQQNTFASAQTDLFRKQNSQIEEQTKLVGLQTGQIDSQINLVRIQNNLSQQEIKLIEAERRSSLIFLMSNVMDKLYEEVEEQRKNIEDRENIFSEKRYNLSPSLMGRIIGLSRAFKPYHVLENGILSKNVISPERGQIIVTLLNSKINNNSLHYMFARGDFSYADLDFSNNESNPFQIDNQSLNLAMFQNAVMKNMSINYTNCHEIQLNGSTLEKIYFNNCNLSKGNFSDATIEVEFHNCNLIEANFTNSDLQNTSFDNSCLCNADFANARNLKVEQFQRVNSLYGVKNLPKEIEEKLGKTLFDKSKCNGLECIF